jgi:uncharacterized protein YqeY
MPLKAQLDADLKDAMRAKDENRMSSIRMLKAAISNFEIARTDPKSPDREKPVTEADLLGVVEKQIKQRANRSKCIKGESPRACGERGSRDQGA